MKLSHILFPLSLSSLCIFLVIHLLQVCHIAHCQWHLVSHFESFVLLLVYCITLYPHILHLVQCPFLLQSSKCALLCYSIFTSHIRGKYLTARRGIKQLNPQIKWKTHTSSTNSINH